tara:strand:- start:39 stop:416 length:378 start_codon:yes stop_codon:yes gene_type:complete
MKTVIIFLSSLATIMATLKQVESDNNPLAIGDNGSSYGILQIQESVVRDVNRIYGTEYQHEDMFSEKASEEVFKLYLCYGKEVFLKKHCRLPNQEELVRMWNGGIYQGYKYKQTKEYYERFLQRR